MKLNLSSYYILCLLSALIALVAAQAESGEPAELLVKGVPHQVHLGSCEFQPRTDESLPYKDTGELLRSVPGVTGGRMGGHGVEPIIRGQSQNQLNVISDGAFAFGACPNRMDPPVSLFAVHGRSSTIRVTRGYQSVRQGPGASGGSIVIESDRPTYDGEDLFSLEATGGYESNGNIRDSTVGGRYVQEGWYLDAAGSWKDADNYSDGAGDDVRSAFRTYGGRTQLGWTPNEDGEVVLSWERQRTDDALFAGAGMDSPRSDSDTLSLRAAQSFEQTDLVGRGAMNIFLSDVDHVMDNYSLRSRAENFMRAPSESMTWGGRAEVEMRPLGQDVLLGIDLIENNRDARRLANGMSSVAVRNLQSVLWPDITVRNLGFFAESPVAVAAGTTLTVGARYDRVSADWGAADEGVQVPSTSMDSMGMVSSVTRTPNDLYTTYYGETARAIAEDNLGGVARVEHRLTEGVTLVAGLARAVRTADATERGIASDGAVERWIGNPGIDPEEHHIVDLGAQFASGRWSSSLHAYYDLVENYILRDRARGQSGVLLSDGASIYRSIDASLSGFEAQWVYSPSDRWRMSADLTYTRGEDEDEDRPLPQIPPVFGAVRVSYQAEDWSAGLASRFAMRQNRGDTNPLTGTGRDVRETPGYGVVDLYGSAKLSQSIELRSGVSNLFDNLYANHLNRSNSFDPEEIQVNEPGRSFFVELRVDLS